MRIAAYYKSYCLFQTVVSCKGVLIVMNKKPLCHFDEGEIHSQDYTEMITIKPMALKKSSLALKCQATE
jgi:hypothetical protein